MKVEGGILESEGRAGKVEGSPNESGGRRDCAWRWRLRKVNSARPSAGKNQPPPNWDGSVGKVKATSASRTASVQKCDGHAVKVEGTF